MVVLCGFSTSQEVGAPILVLFNGQLYDCLGYVPKKKTAEREREKVSDPARGTFSHLISFKNSSSIDPVGGMNNVCQVIA